MVRVIEQAALKQTTCRSCKCKLEYAFNDMKFNLLSRDGYQAEIQCPNCSGFTYVPVNF